MNNRSMWTEGDLREVLDGLWEFRPEAEAAAVPDGEVRAVPASGYERERIRVPGYWNSLPDAIGGDWGAYDHYGYPPQWQKAEAAWYRLRFPAVRPPGLEQPRVRLRFDAVAGAGEVWLNGVFLGSNHDSFLPFAFDVSDDVMIGKENELAVFVGPPAKRDGLWLQPCGSWVGWHMRGIWQPVCLEYLPTPSVEDIFVQPSVRQNRLTVDVTVSAMREPLDVEVRLAVLDGDRVVLDMGRRPVRTANGSEQRVRFTADGPNLEWWSPESPKLYHVRAELGINGLTLHARAVRFGFREFWIEGTGFRLNGQPIRLFGDSWHYMGPAQQNPAYARTWYELARRTGVTAIRTHAMPYPPCYFDVADEMGMMLIDESAVYGSAGTLGTSHAQFWENARDHVRRLVRRDRNHPSVIFWSLCNETVWKGGEAVFEGLLSLADEARALDPTRFASFDENDCDVGGKAPLHAGHYGTPRHWDRSWKRDRPLVVHEFSSLYHGGPEWVSPLGNDAVYADYLTRLRFAGKDAADMFLRLRSLGAASITPWNINWYCLEPIPVRAVENVPEDAVEDGAPIRRIGPRALPFNYGYTDREPAWRENPAYAPLAACYQRRRFFLPRRPRQAFGGDTITLAAELWNDTAEPADVVTSFRVVQDSRTLAETTVRSSLPGYGSEQVALASPLPDVTDALAATAELVMRSSSDGAVLHTESWLLHVHPRERRAVNDKRKAWILGNADVPATFGLQRLRRDGLAEAIQAGSTTTVVLAGGASDRTLRDWLEQPDVDGWLRQGGRLVVCADGVADDALQGLSPIRRSADHAYPRDEATGLLRGLTDDHFRDWGPDGVVATAVFQRPSTGPALAPLDVGDCAEGLSCSPLVVIPVGAGHVVLTGMPLLERCVDTPAAAIVLRRLLNDPLPTPTATPVACVGEAEFAADPLFADVGLAAAQNAGVVICDGGSMAALADPRTSAKAVEALLAEGGTLLLDGLVPETVTAWSHRLGLQLGLREDVCFNVAWADRESPLAAGLNNYDLCWVLRDDAQPIVRHSLDMPETGRVLVQTVATRWEGYQTAAEQHKAALMYRRLEAFGGSRAVVVEIPRGPGRILISQLRLREARGIFRPRARRILSRWLDVMGAARQEHVNPLTPREPRAMNADGYITQWLVLGPFAGQAGCPLDHAFVDEATMRPEPEKKTGDLAWRRVSSAFAEVDLARALGELPQRDRVAYAATWVYSPQDRSVLLDVPDMIALLGAADGGLKAFLNGSVIGRFDFVRELVLDSDPVEGLPFRKGWNLLVIKLHNPSGPWRFAARLMTAAGEPAGDLECSTAPPD